jgi:hypothetical protein
VIFAGRGRLEVASGATNSWLTRLPEKWIFSGF